MRTLLVTLVTCCALLTASASATAATPKIRAKAIKACEITYAITTDAGKAAIRRACPRVWATFDARLTDRQIRIWARDLEAKRDPVRFMPVWSAAMQRHQPR